MSTRSKRQRFRNACLASKLVFLLVATSLFVLPVRSGCTPGIGIVGVPYRAAPLPACHVQTVAALTASWMLPTGVTPALLPNTAHVLPVLAFLMFIGLAVLSTGLPVEVARRLKYMRGIWATTLPYKGTLPKLPYFAPQRDA